MDFVNLQPTAVCTKSQAADLNMFMTSVLVCIDVPNATDFFPYANWFELIILATRKTACPVDVSSVLRVRRPPQLSNKKAQQI